MYTKRKLTVAGIALLAMLVFVFVSGCGSCGEKLASEALERVAEQQAGGDVEIDSEGGTITISGGDENSGGTMAFGENVSMPSNWPPEAKIFDGAKPVMVMVGDDGAFGTFQTKADADKISSFYEGHFKSQGWKLNGSMATPMGKTLVFEQGDKNCTITVSPAGNDSDQNTFTITYAEEKS
ncbi:MAG: hypothetical protein P9M14_09565 [Candidatus Alcyoniella australis]|nr:hypothetical protein [Candidatus Alcyoniella australis]